MLVLALSHPKSPTVVSADVSSYSFAAKASTRDIAANRIHFSISNHHWTAICSSWKRVLALMWACGHILDYLRFHIYTDHKPLVPLFINKSLYIITFAFRGSVFEWWGPTIQYHMSLVSNWSSLICYPEHQQTFLVAVMYILNLALKHVSIWFYKVFQLPSSIWLKSRSSNPLTESVLKWNNHQKLGCYLKRSTTICFLLQQILNRANCMFGPTLLWGESMDYW